MEVIWPLGKPSRIFQAVCAYWLTSSAGFKVKALGHTSKMPGSTSPSTTTLRPRAFSTAPLSYSRFSRPVPSAKSQIRHSAPATRTWDDICPGALTRQGCLQKNLRCTWNHEHPPIECKDVPRSGVDEWGELQYVLCHGLQHHAPGPCRRRFRLPCLVSGCPSRAIHERVPYGPHHRSLQRLHRRCQNRSHRRRHKSPLRNRHQRLGRILPGESPAQPLSPRNRKARLD